MTRKTRITSEVDLEQSGKQQGFLRLPHSVHRSAYGWIPIPIIVVKNGTGPTVLLTSGNHGDEYEGQLALIKLSSELDPESVQGRIIFIPAVNYPAVIGGLRTSPVDELNLNRSFPGDPDGRPTQAIAHYVESELLPLADYALDLHSGGSSLTYVPSTLCVAADDDRLAAAQLDMLRAFAAPLAYIATGDEDRTMLAAARRAGVAAIGTELGGSGSATVESVRIAERGVRRVLRHVGVLPDVEVGDDPPPTRIMEVRGSDDYVYSPEYGIWEPLVDLGVDVQAGQVAAAVYSPQTPWREPVLARFAQSGKVICRRIPSLVERGDCLYHLAADRGA